MVRQRTESSEESHLVHSILVIYKAVIVLVEYIRRGYSFKPGNAL